MAIKLERLQEAFGEEEGAKVRAILDHELTYDSRFGDDPIFEQYPQTGKWVRSCYNPPKCAEIRMSLINEAIGGHGCEAIFGDHDATWPDMEYVNMGDTYTTTIIHDYLKGKYRLMSWGDWVEEAEREGRTYA